MKIDVTSWQDADVDELRQLYYDYPYPPYFGSPIVNAQLQAYRFENVQKSASVKSNTAIVVKVNGKILGAVQLQRVAHLSNHFGVEVGELTNEAFSDNGSPGLYQGGLSLFSSIKNFARLKKYIFVTTTVASQALNWIRALEESGFRYADGFRHAIEDIDMNYDEFLIKKLNVRDPIESDFREISYSFTHMPFPSYLFYEPEFEKDLIVDLYTKRYREIYEKKLGRVFVGEMNGKFMGALNGILDQDILCKTGIAVNHLSQGIIIHPRAKGKGIALSLIAFRHNWYREHGVKYGYVGSNINNIPMIRGLEKLKAKHAGIKISMVLRLEPYKIRKEI